ncbi:LrgB family protein [Geomesophilobacter sediminis]|uniref:LrgB family protein n=1 Tax=Geomesophilobacter sediminis TaxID=2798584 RepID=A0A8J7J8G9_9BACT|nr:LrgB family protein [Geomesophilobacter sediminis]MBJ6725906.1 LrgB family protein [Geomesophilobacter sediminis]
MYLPSIDVVLPALAWSAVTIALYFAGKMVHRRFPRWWSSPLLLAPLLLVVVALAFRVTYGEYIRGTHWLVALLAPATVSFAVPIFEQWPLIRRYWLLLVVGMLVGSATSMLSSWGLATLFGLDDSVRLSLLPRSLSTPFAMIVSGDIGGTPALTAVFVVITGVFGAIIGEMVLTILPLRSSLARGALLGMGAHGAGTAKAYQIDREVGAIAGLVMVLVGVLNVLAASLLPNILK